MSMQKGTKLVAALLIAAFASVAGLVRHFDAPPAEVSRLEHQKQMKQREVQQRFEQAVVMLHARQYDHAMAALYRVLQLAPRMPEAHVNMGYALIGAQQPDAAHGFFLKATELNPRQGNAYYGLALVAESQGDYEAALGYMRTYLHFSPEQDPHRARARSALWEWEEKLGRHKPDAATPRPPVFAAPPASSPAR
jgi:tetratricopeptide (TPR) repeat protein